MPRESPLDALQPEQLGLRRRDPGVEDEDPRQVLRPIGGRALLRRPLQVLQTGERGAALRSMTAATSTPGSVEAIASLIASSSRVAAPRSTGEDNQSATSRIRPA